MPPPPTRAKLPPAAEAALAALNWKGGIAVAVSGGGDSVALMHMLAAHAARRRLPPPLVLTVDHRLRAGSSRDARQVGSWAKALGLEARILTWTADKPQKGIEAAARDARYRLMGSVLKKRGIATLCVGHSQDDQAETFLLRLQRGSGLDGLAAMQPVAPYPVPGFAAMLARPLLDVPRAALRAFLTARKQPWLEDPMNGDPGFARVKLRQALAGLDIPLARIAAAAAHLARVRAALDTVTDAVLARAVQAAPDGLLLDPGALTAAPRELGLRGLASLLMTVSGQAYRPRFEALERLYDRLAAGTLAGGATLHGCRLGPAPAKNRVFGPATLKIAPESARSRSRTA